MTSNLIVCATDFSPQSERALLFAGILARRAQGRIDLVHAVPAPSERMEDLAADARVFEAERRGRAGADLTRIASAAALEAGVPVQPLALEGDAHCALVDHARQEQAALIVMGASGRSTLERWILGSVAERTVRSASCPVVLVPRDHDPGPWMPSSGNRPPRVVVGLGGAGGSDELFDLVVGLRRKAPCDVTFVHLYWPMEEYTRLGLRGPRDLFEADPEVVRNLEPKLWSEIGALPGLGEVKLEIRPAFGEPAANLLLALDSQRTDLLVVGSERRHGFARHLTGGSVGERLARHVHRMALVCVPARPRGAARQPRLPHVLTVLAATDLSPLGNAAIPHAYAQLHRGGVVELCHVYERPVPSPAYVYDRPGQRLGDKERGALEAQLRALIPGEAEGLGITTHVSVIDGGDPAGAIAQAAERLNVDLITVGSHGRSGLGRAILGSVAQEVLHRAHQPVLVIR